MSQTLSTISTKAELNEKSTQLARAIDTCSKRLSDIQSLPLTVNNLFAEVANISNVLDNVKSNQSQNNEDILSFKDKHNNTLQWVKTLQAEFNQRLFEVQRKKTLEEEMNAQQRIHEQELRLVQEFQNHQFQKQHFELYQARMKENTKF